MAIISNSNNKIQKVKLEERQASVGAGANTGIVDKKTDSISNHKMMNIFELKEHILKECPKSRTCVQCHVAFDTVQQFHEHI